ncbi:MAG: heme ABC exporter ATP-binding protein CcmA [Thermoplasmata archaeon]|nr:MAG: heme ABC exporter ATP-binding protein CcmA [Thermoplasmata archaeon]
MNEILTINNLSKQFGKKRVLNDLKLHVPRGEFLTIFGPNGAGKTTLIKIISTLSRPSSGEITIADYDLTEEPENIRKLTGVISHNVYLYDELTAKENLKFYGQMYSYPSDKLDKRILSLLNEIGLQYRMNDRVGTFSRGMKQRLSIARAILHEPQLLLLDEPYTGLDQHAAQILNRILKHLHNGKRTIIMTTHNIELGFNLCDRVAILNHGQITYEKTRKQINVSKLKKAYMSEVEGILHD